CASVFDIFLTALGGLPVNFLCMALLAAKLPPGDGRFAPGAMLCVGAKVAHAGHLYYNEGVDARHRPGNFAAATAFRGRAMLAPTCAVFFLYYTKV
ncbi:MAG: hypothetical protein PUF73_05300, partial [Gemmiger formicilis]|nr:hypothetical protein [Gemmiger formicilis]